MAMKSYVYLMIYSKYSNLLLAIILLIIPISISAGSLRPFSSDGCSHFPEGTAEDRNLWCDCCFQHDVAYWQGGTIAQKKLADLNFKSCIAEKSNNTELAGAMYLAVKLGGQPYFPTSYRWGYGWPHGRQYKELTAEELQLVSTELKHYKETTTNMVCTTSPPNDKDSSNLITSDLADDETIVFFNTFAIPPQANERWTIPIHGWVYEPEVSVVRKGTFATYLKQHYGLEVTPETQPNFDQRVNLFLADNERRKHMVIRIGDQIFPMAPTEPNGHFHTELKLEDNIVQTLSKQGILEFELVLDNGDKRSFYGKALIPAKKGISVISDVDDTIKVTEVLDSTRLWENTFYNDFVSVPRMAELYRGWADHGAIFHFVSSSPWQLYTPINTFLQREDFPPASYSMKYVRFKDNTFFNLFKSGAESKPLQIEPILQALPGHQFILVGDSGEQDPEVYAAIAQKYPEQVIRIYIRKVPGNIDRDYETLFAAIPANKWRLFTNPGELEMSSNFISGTF